MVKSGIPKVHIVHKIWLYLLDGLVRIFPYRFAQPKMVRCCVPRRRNGAGYCGGPKRSRWPFAGERICARRSEQGLLDRAAGNAAASVAGGLGDIVIGIGMYSNRATDN